jgi:single-strand DNA-binding protein
MALNKVMLIGNVGNDPEVRYLESNPQNPSGNVKVASFRLATTERYRDRSGELRENTEWHSIVVWRNNADVVEKFVHKGTQIYIEGKLRTRQWTDQSGNKRFTTEVVADNLQLLGKRPEGEGAGYQGGYAQGSGSQGGYAQGAGPQGGYASGAGSQGGYAQGADSIPAGFQPASAGYQPSSQPSPSQAGTPGPGGPASQPGAPVPPQPVNPDYQGPLPAAEPSDDLPF